MSNLQSLRSILAQNTTMTDNQLDNFKIKSKSDKKYTEIPLTDWAVELIEQCYRVRATIEPLNADKTKSIINSLKNDNYPFYRRYPAELWILRGNWQFKKNKIIELPDFYPTKNQLDSLADDLISVADLEVLVMELNVFFRNDYLNKFRDWQNNQKKENYIYSLTDNQKKINRILLQNITISQEMEIMEKQVEPLQRRIGELERMNVKLISDNQNLLDAIKKYNLSLASET